MLMKGQIPQVRARVGLKAFFSNPDRRGGDEASDFAPPGLEKHQHF